MDESNPVLGVVGLGKLGSPMAAVFAEAGYQVIGTDLNKAAVDTLNRGQAPVDETDLQTYVTAGIERIRATTDPALVGEQADVIFVIVPTPSDANHRFSNDYVLSAVRNLAAGIRKNDGEKLVVITSTVMPGSTGGPIRQALEEVSGRTLGETLGLCYNPEFIALGSVIADMHYPDFILIGESAAKWGDILEQIYKKSCRNDPEFERMNFVNAELTKIAVNTFTTTKISYANMLSEMCDKLDGADADVVSHAVGADSRVGRKYLKGGVGYGGPCFPRDNKAFIQLAADLGANAALAQATDTVNDHQLQRFEEALLRYADPRSSVGVVGLAYKNKTQVVEASQGWLIAARSAQLGRDTLVYDPEVQEAPKGCRIADTLDGVLAGADIVLLMLPYADFEASLSRFLSAAPKRLTVIDPWRMARSLQDHELVDYIALGLGNAK